MLTVELISIAPVAPEDPMGASLSWVAGALSVPVVEIEPASIGDFVWNDVNMNGIQEDGEEGIAEVVVHLLDCFGQVLDTTETDVDGMYWFTQLMPGNYNIQFELPDGYVFSPQNQGNDPALDSDADPANGTTDCTTLDAGENDDSWDAGMYMPLQEGCTRTKGYWMTHAGFGPQDDVVTPLLPIWLGDSDGDKSIAVTDNGIAYDILGQHEYGHPNNSITKLYAQLLAAKLNFASGASGEDVADTVDDADAFLADHDWNDWASLSDDDKDMVRGWHGMLDRYNKGEIGPGHCDAEEDDEGNRKIATFK
jgi:hypothetical protein